MSPREPHGPVSDDEAQYEKNMTDAERTLANPQREDPDDVDKITNQRDVRVVVKR